MARKAVRRPRIDVDARHVLPSHGLMTPLRGIYHSTESHDYAGLRDLSGIVEFWRGQGRGLGSHVIIDLEGKSALVCDFNHVMYHTEDRNTGSVGIELVGYSRFNAATWWRRRAQLDKLAKWIAYLNLEYGIPMVFNVNRGWSGHRDQTKAFHLSSGHTDPGAFFPKGYVLRLAKKYRREGWA